MLKRRACSGSRHKLWQVQALAACLLQQQAQALAGASSGGVCAPAACMLWQRVCSGSMQALTAESSVRQALLGVDGVFGLPAALLSAGRVFGLQGAVKHGQSLLSARRCWVQAESLVHQALLGMGSVFALPGTVKYGQSLVRSFGG